MCGLFGMITSRWAKDFPRALASLAPRGPDGCGVWQADDVWLGHRRLAVIDPHGGAQPMSSEDGRYHLLFNGEIYNFRALRQELEAHQQRFLTTSDSEVLLKAYMVWGGEAMLNKLDGMFAFGIWDHQRRSLFAARDPMGIKPLFYATVDGFLLASTLEPFWHLTGFPRKLNYEALRDYLACQSIFAPLSILQDVHVLPPACWLRWEADDKQLTVGQYWEIPGPTATPLALPELVERCDAALQQSVQRQLVADVPVGAFLSGGVDSSLIVHYMAQATSQPIQTFSVQFADAAYDESGYAHMVAQQYGCAHHVFAAHRLDAPLLQQAIRCLDQPLADPAYLPTLALSALSRQHITVALSGDGGDELFCGYERFLLQESDVPDAAWYRLLRRGIEAHFLPGRLLSYTLRGRDRLLWKRLQLGPYATSRKSMQHFLTPEAWAACQPDKTLAQWFAQVLRFRQHMDTDSLMRGDLWTYLSDNCLSKVDRASMHHGLEVRVPLLGQPVLQVVLPQPAVLHTCQGLKTVLKHLARRYLPQAVWDRPKHGFSMPLRTYFHGDWHAVCDAWVQACRELAPFLRPQAVQQYWRRFQNGHGSLRLMYTWMVLLGWHESHPVDP